jgi:hypothetical protein
LWFLFFTRKEQEGRGKRVVSRGKIFVYEFCEVKSPLSFRELRPPLNFGRAHVTDGLDRQ